MTAPGPALSKSGLENFTNDNNMKNCLLLYLFGLVQSLVVVHTPGDIHYHDNAFASLTNNLKVWLK